MLALNYARGFLDAFEFLLKMATSLGLIYYVVVALAEFRHSMKSAKAWASVAIVGIAYSIFAAFGSGVEVLLWGFALMAAGVPLYFLFKRNGATAAPNPTS